MVTLPVAEIWLLPTFDSNLVRLIDAGLNTTAAVLSGLSEGEKVVVGETGSDPAAANEGESGER